MNELQSTLAPCPFCAKPLELVARKHNPYGRCATENCKGAQLPLLNLDIPEDLVRWNTRNGLPFERTADTGVEEDAMLFRWACEHGFPLCMQQIHPAVGEPYWSYGDMDSTGYATAKEAIQAAMRAEGDCRT